LTQYMLLFSLGPVQSFITQARKTRDLWLGSFLLSVLMQESMKNITKTHLVFPAEPRIIGYVPNLPNKYIATFETSDDAVKAAKKSKENIVDAWRNICNDVWNAILAKVAGNNSVTHTQWDAQTNPANMFEIFWVVVAGDEQNYKEWLTETQLMFDRRKHLRDFTQQIEVGEKSTISGQRAALRRSGEERFQVRDFWYDVAIKRSQRDINYDGSERLDAIDTVKRFAHLSDSLAQLVEHQSSQDFKAGFPSTSSIATASFVEQLLPASEHIPVATLETWLRESKKLNEYMPATIPLLKTEASRQRYGMEILGCDGDCYFPETFSAKRLEKEFRFDDTRKDERDKLAKDGSNAVATLLRVTGALTPPITRPTPYYAMIQMDGDKMGRLINGVHNKEEHQAISGALSIFSRGNVPNIVERDYPGRLIYAGGDDVFALAPLARDIVQMGPIQEGVPQTIGTVLDLVDQLQQQYNLVVGQKAPVSYKEPVTASTGIAIAHHYTPLSYVRRVSKEAEQLAKNHYGRNALVVTVLRRSGEQTRVGCKWLYADLPHEAQPMRLFATFYGLFVNNVLSPSAVHTLLEEVSTLVGLLEDAQASEIKRVLKRQRNPAMKGLFPDSELETKAKYLVDLARKMDREEKPDKKQGMKVDLHAEERRYGLVEVLGWLRVLLFLARKEQE